MRSTTASGRVLHADAADRRVVRVPRGARRCCRVPRRRIGWSCFIAYAGTLFAIEYLYLHEAGYLLQGRYSPASIGLGAWLLMHRGTVARATLLSSVVALNVLLFGLTVQRYYAGD